VQRWRIKAVVEGLSATVESRRKFQASRINMVGNGKTIIVFTWDYRLGRKTFR